MDAAAGAGRTSVVEERQLDNGIVRARCVPESRRRAMRILKDKTAFAVYLVYLKST